MDLFLALLLAISFTIGIEGGSKSPKKGLVIPYWPRHKIGDFEAFDTISWWYNYHEIKEVQSIQKWWCTDENGQTPSDYEVCFPQDPEVKFVPMRYAPDGYGRGPPMFPIPALNISDDSQVILSFNEPNQPDQANMSPRIAAQEHKKLCDQHPDSIMVSPATGNADTEWFDEFWEECAKIDCRIDYLATHLYKGSVDQRMEKLKAYSQRYADLKIWYTEFAVALEDDENEIVQLVEELLPRLEHADFIERYAWFYTRYYIDHDHTDESPWFWLDSYNSLLQENGPYLTAVGEAYNKPWHLEEFKPLKKD